MLVDAFEFVAHGLQLLDDCSSLFLAPFFLCLLVSTVAFSLFDRFLGFSDQLVDDAVQLFIFRLDLGVLLDKPFVFLFELVNLLLFVSHVLFDCILEPCLLILVV